MAGVVFSTKTKMMMQVVTLQGWVMPIIGVVTFLVLVAAAVVLIWARRGDIVVTTQTARGDALDSLLDARTKERDDLQKKYDAELQNSKDISEELEALTVEHRALTGITIKDLLIFAAEKDKLEADLEQCKRRCRVLTLQLDGPTTIPRD